LPTTRVGRTIRAMPPSMSAALVVTLPITTLSGGHTSEAMAEHEQANANPHNALQAGELCPQLTRRVLLGRPQFCASVGFLALDHRHRRAEDEGGAGLRVER